MDDREESLAATLDRLARRILDASFTVHSRLGPGLLESAYESCLTYELEKRGLGVERQKVLPLEYDDLHLDAGYRVDLLVEQLVVVEVNKAQVLTYLKLGAFHLGLLLNFNVDRLKLGIHRLVWEFPDP